MPQPLFQKRHYEAIAEVFAKIGTLDRNITDAIVGLSRMFELDNPNYYNPAQFYHACTSLLCPPEEAATQEEHTVKLNSLEPINWGELRAVKEVDR